MTLSNARSIGVLPRSGAGARRTRVAVFALGAAIGLITLAPATHAAIEVEGRSVRLGWSQTSGPVAGYGVFVARNGADFGAMPESITLPADPSVSLAEDFGDRVSIRVAAFDSNGNFGPFSDASPEILFVDPNVSAPPPQPPPGDGGGDPQDGGDPGPDDPDLDEYGCTERIGPVRLDGKEVLKLRKVGKERSEATTWLMLCEGSWVSVGGPGASGGGTYEVLDDEGRKIRLTFSDGDTAGLVSALSVQGSQMQTSLAQTRLRSAPKVMVTLNRDRTLVRLENDVKVKAEKGRKGKTVKGSYKLRLSGDLGPGDIDFPR